MVMASTIDIAEAQELSLKVGDNAPGFAAKTFGGEAIQLKDYQGKKNVILYFYPKDDTPGCTKEACSFRDNLERLINANTAVLGVSVDDVASHEEFRDKYQLNFDLVADTDHTIVKKYGVLKKAKNNRVVASRVTFLIDKEGVIRHIWSPVKVDGHTDEVLDQIKVLKLS